MPPVGPGEGPPHLVGLGRGHARHVHDELYHLLLPDDDSLGREDGSVGYDEMARSYMEDRFQLVVIKWWAWMDSGEP